MHTRDLLTDAERERVSASMTFGENGTRFGTVTLDHPTRLHQAFIKGNTEVEHHTVLESVDLGDGYTRVTYQLSDDADKRRQGII